MEKIYRILKGIERKGFASSKDLDSNIYEEQGLIARRREDGYTSFVLTDRGRYYIEIFETFMSYFESDTFFKTFEENN